MTLFFSRKKKQKTPPPPPPPPKVLVLRFSSIGDIVLTTPVIRCLKQQRPEVEIHYLTKEAFKGILEANPYIDKLLTFSQGIDEVLPALKGEAYTHLIDLHNNLRTTRIKQALNGVPAFTFRKLNVKKWLYVNLRLNLMPPTSIVERYMDTVKEWGVRNDGKGLDFFVPDKDRITNEDVPMSHWAGYVACVIGGSYSTKQMPISKWQQFCKASPYPVMLLGGKEDREMGEEIASVDKVKVYNACGKFSLNESADLVNRARVVVSHDTGLMHIAAAFQKPLVSLWGNTTPWLGMYPYYGFNDLKQHVAPQSLNLVVGLGCQPCSKLGYGRCPRGHFKCMNRQEPEKMVGWVEKNWS